MISYSPSNTANEAWLRAIYEVFLYGRTVVPRGKKTRELQHRLVSVDMSYPVVTIPDRKLSYPFMAAEAYWILSGDDTVAGIAPYNKQIAAFSDDGETFFGAYGPPIAKQLNYVVETLIHDRDSRQAGLTIWHPNPPKTKDMPCTVSIFAMIRQDALHLHVFMRSSDIWLGLPYDVFNFSMLGHLICSAYNIDVPEARQIRVGTLYLTAASQHLYEINFDSASGLHYELPPSPPVPYDASHSPSFLLKLLKDLRETIPGDPLRWWEGAVPS